MAFLIQKKSARNHIALIRNSTLFNETFYRKSYGINRYVNAEQHFYTSGWKMDFKPSPFFDTAFYLKTYDDVRNIGINPLIHYLLDGGPELRRPAQEFDAQSYCAAHPDYNQSGKTPAEHCIDLYGSYQWRGQPQSIPTRSEGAAETFRSVFDGNFYKSHNADVSESGMDPFEHFLNFGQFEYRDPSASFEAFFYHKKFAAKDGRGKSLVDTYHEQIQRIAPQTENAESIHADLEAHAAAATQSSLRLCVHAHCFYPELIKELIPGFQNLPPSAAIVITAVRAADAQFIRHALSRHRIGQSVEVRVVPNRGRDIAPFLVGCQDIWRDFDIVLHLHTKVSSHVYWGAEWRNYLFDQTLSSKKLVDWVLGTFSDNPTLGCLYPRNFYRIREFVNAEQNSHLIGAFMEVLGFSAGSATQPDYPAGSMAWYRTDALTRLVDALPNLDRFEDEEDQVDLTFAHALERILTLVVRASGYEVRNYITERRTRLVPAPGLPDRESSGSEPSKAWPRDTPRLARKPPVPVAPVNRLYNPGSLDVHWILPSFAQGALAGT